MSRTIKIYALSSPTDLEKYFYVGKTCNLSQRLAQHCYPDGFHNENLRTRLSSILSTGVRPCIIILEEVPKGEQWQQKEREWIARLLLLGHPLTNIHPGGTGSKELDRPRSEFQRKSASQAMKRLWAKKEFRDRMSTLFKLRWKDKAERRKLLDANHRTRRKAAEKMKLRWKDPVFRRKWKEANPSGWHHTIATKKKIGLFHRRRHRRARLLRAAAQSGAQR